MLRFLNRFNAHTPRGTRWLPTLLLAALVIACGGGGNSAPAGDGGLPGADAGTIGDPCTEGTHACSGNDLLVCGNDGELVFGETCANGCSNAIGCLVCVPGTGSCSGEVSTFCEADGSGYVDLPCDPVQGMSCDVDTGLCAGACAPQELGRNYIGCEYYPTITANPVLNRFSFAVAVSNLGSSVASVRVAGGALAAQLAFTVQPGTVEVRELPWVPALKACENTLGSLDCIVPKETSTIAAGGAYHLRSDQPVTVYQFNPLDYRLMGSPCGPDSHDIGCSYSNDASLLLPVNALTGHYIAASWQGAGGQAGPPGFITVTATKDDTQVTITTTADTQAGSNLAAFVPGTPQTITLNAGDAAQLFAMKGGDLTGSLIRATKSVQLLGGHYCTAIPTNVLACDHLEESIFPYETLGRRYLVAAPAVPTLPSGKVRVVRIVATEPNTTLQYQPAQAGAATSIAEAGQFIEIFGTDEAFQVLANSKILVVGYMEGQGAGGDIGDPSMALQVPVAQYREAYQFHAPQNYLTLHVDVVAPLSATVVLDGDAIPTLSAIGSTGYGLARIELAKNGTGNYEIQADKPFGISVYGYGAWTSFWYPGGLDLAPIVIE